jgi:hypothetical protein
LDQGWTKRLVPGSERADFVRGQLLHQRQEAKPVHLGAEETRRQVAVDALGELRVLVPQHPLHDDQRHSASSRRRAVSLRKRGQDVGHRLG